MRRIKQARMVRKTDFARILCGALALAVMLASLPLAIGVILVPDEGTVAFTADVCHPLNNLQTSAATVIMARPSPSRPQPLLTHAGRVHAGPVSPLEELLQKPLLPPPRTLG